MHDLLVGALDRAAPDAVTQAKIFVIVHALRVLAVAANQIVELFAHVRSSEFLRNLMSPTFCLWGTFAVSQASELPRVLDRACQKSRISQRDGNMAARFQIHLARSPTITTMVPADVPIRDCRYRRRFPQVTRTRRTTERRPGDDWKRSTGKSKHSGFHFAKPLVLEVGQRRQGWS